MSFFVYYFRSGWVKLCCELVSPAGIDPTGVKNRSKTYTPPPLFFILFKRESSVFDEHFKVKHQIAVYGVNGISVKTTQNIFYIIVSHYSATRSNRVSNQLAWTDKD